MLVNLDELYTKTWFDQSRSNDPVEFTKISWREIPLLTDECVMKCIRWWSPENHTLTLLCDFILYPSAGNCGYIQIPPSGTINQSAFPPTFMLCVFFKYFGGFLINLDGELYGWYLVDTRYTAGLKDLDCSVCLVLICFIDTCTR